MSRPLPPEIAGLTARDLHPEIVKDTEKGRWTILDFFDSHPWLTGGADWTAWRAFLAALYALPMTDAELRIYRQCTGRRLPPDRPAEEAWMPVGRRGRKSAIMAVIASFVAAYRDHSKYLAPGEVGRIPVLSVSKEDARQIRTYVDAIFSTPALAWMVEKEGNTTETLPLWGRVSIDIRAATIKAGRGKASPLAILDEVAFFRSDESANPDRDIVTGIKGSFANVPDTLLLAASSPYARRGLLYEMHRDHFGRDKSSILVWMAPTVVMHRTPLIEEHVAKETAKDPVAAAAEYGDEETIRFREDVEAFLTDELLDAATPNGVDEIPPCDDTVGWQYVGFADASGGRSDSFAVGIAHQEGTVSILDAVLEVRAPFDPLKGAIPEAVAFLGRYGVKVVEGDAYAGEWVASAFSTASIGYQLTEYGKSELYTNFLPLLTTSGKARLLDIPRLRAQLLGLDRRALAGGREVIDHQKGQHDDVANAVAGVMFRCSRLRLPAKPNTEPRTLVDAHRRKIQERLKQRMQDNDTKRDQGEGGWIG